MAHLHQPHAKHKCVFIRGKFSRFICICDVLEQLSCFLPTKEWKGTWGGGVWCSREACRVFSFPRTKKKQDRQSTQWNRPPQTFLHLQHIHFVFPHPQSRSGVCDLTVYDTSICWGAHLVRASYLSWQEFSLCDSDPCSWTERLPSPVQVLTWC